MKRVSEWIKISLILRIDGNHWHLTGALVSHDGILPSSGRGAWRDAQKDDLGSFADRARDFREIFLCNSNTTINDPKAEWKSAKKFDDLANNYAQLGRALRERLTSHSPSNMTEDEEADPHFDPDWSDDIQHLGKDVFALRPDPLHKFSFEDDADLSQSGQIIIVRTRAIGVTKRALAELETGRRTYVVGQPGIGKTRGGLSYALMELLADGAVVARLNCKSGIALLFVPIPDDNGLTVSYRIWQTEINLWDSSALRLDPRMICLVDPPEVGSKLPADLGIASSIIYCSNNKAHYPNAYKDHNVFYYPLPSEDEVVAMTPILWRESDHNDPTNPHLLPDLTHLENIEGRRDRKQEVKFRIRLLGVAAPRYIFSWKNFTTRVEEIVLVSETQKYPSMSLEEATKIILGKRADVDSNASIANSTARLYNIDLVDPLISKRMGKSKMWTEFEVKFNDLAALSLYECFAQFARLQVGASGGWVYESVAILLLRLGGHFHVFGSTEKGGKGSINLPKDKEAESLFFPRRECLSASSREDCKSILSKLESSANKMLEPAAPNFPGIDCATSRLDWFQVKVTPEFALDNKILCNLLDSIDIQTGEMVTLTLVHNCDKPSYRVNPASKPKVNEGAKGVEEGKDEGKDEGAEEVEEGAEGVEEGAEGKGVDESKKKRKATKAEILWKKRDNRRRNHIRIQFLNSDQLRWHLEQLNKPGRSSANESRWLELALNEPWPEEWRERMFRVRLLLNTHLRLVKTLKESPVEDVKPCDVTDLNP